MSEGERMDGPLKIGLFSPYDHAVHGGVQSHVNEIAGQFRNWGHRVRIVAPASAPDSIPDPDFVPMGRAVPLPSAGSVARVSLSVWLHPRIKDLLARERFDVIHSHEPLSGYVPLAALTMADARRTVNIATFHSYRRRRVWWAIGSDKLANPLLNPLDGRLAVSPPAAEFINRHFPGDYRVIPNGIRVEDFARAKPVPELMDGKTNILFLGRLEKRKGLRYLLSAYSKLKWDNPDLRLIVVGGGSPDAESYRIMGERNLQDVIFTGRVSDEMRASYFKSAHVYCSPATGNESFGIVLLEAMAAGAPVAATSIAGYASVIRHGHDGLLVPPKDEDALAAAIDTLVRDPSLRARLSANGVRTADAFRWERVAAKVMDFYAEFAPRHRAENRRASAAL